ncbi:hypothetical protein KGF54_001609 [Candida jiufengensis]|uniref:uncharacterized protein n=1 Tax=Candida jiufengensis TaxID=497108 RepID=UPI0022257D88|nr:uncharacterized protein KGF54_001609 [Candida jiufengensis]KAI5955048.1 hypothetical protein KGF54_001609 [Candida jiufengensis]
MSNIQPDSAFLDFLKTVRGSSDNKKLQQSSSSIIIKTDRSSPGEKRLASEAIENNEEGLKRIRTSSSEVSKSSAFGEAIFDKEPSHRIGFLDLQKLEYAAKTLQKNVATILQSAPDYYELLKVINSTDVDSSTRNEIKTSELMSLASKLKSKHKLGQLPILDQIFTNEINVTDEDQEELAKMDASSSKSVVYNVPRSATDEISITGINNDLPPLPKINDVSLYEKVFVHKSGINNRTYLGTETLVQRHNERLEFLGDSVLNNLVTLIIFRIFPACDEGQLSRIRSDLINNNTLRKLAFQYGFDKKLRTNFASDPLKPTDSKIYADVFEAYVGALAVERGLNVQDIQDWLEKLYEPQLNVFRRKYLKTPVDRDAKSQLYAVIGRADLRPVYEIVATGDGINTDFVVDCKMNGEFLGRGIAQNSKDAGLNAAANALENTSVLEKYALERAEIEKPVRLQRKERNELKRLEKLKKLEESKNGSQDGENEDGENQDKASEEEKPFVPDSPIHTDLFPIEVYDDIELKPDAKNKLYALIGSKTGTKPEYLVTQNEFGKFTINLKIRDLLIGTSVDTSKKRAMSKVANALMNDEAALKELCKRF